MIRYFYILILLVFLSFSNILFSQDANILQKIAGTSNDYGKSIGVDSSGNIYVLGDFNSSSLSFNNSVSLSSDGSGDLYLAKYNNSGACQWAQKISGPGSDVASKLVVDKAGNIYFTGYSSSSFVNFNNGYSISNSGSNDAFLAKYNTNGLCQWVQKMAGTNSDYAYGIGLDQSNNIYVSGNYSSSIINFNNGITLSNSGSLDVFITKYNNNGLCQWAQKIYGSSAEYAYSVALDNNDNLFVTGYYSSSTLNFNNGITLSNSGSSDIFISKYSTSGTCQWAKKVSGTAVDESYTIDVDSKGNAYFSGSFTSSSISFDGFTSLSNFAQRDIFLSKIDNNGNFKWANRIYGNSNDFGRYIHIDRYDNLWLGGYYTSDSLIFSNTVKLQEIQGTDAFIAKFDTNGIPSKVNRIYGNVSDYLEGICSNSNDSVLVVGYFNSNKLYFNSDSLSQTGLNDAYFVSTDGTGGGGGGGGDDDGGDEQGNGVVAQLITPLDKQIGVSIRPVFSSNVDSTFTLYLSTDSTFTNDVDTLVSNGKYLNMPFNLQFNTTYYAKSHNTISFKTQVFRKDLMWNWRNSYPQGNDLNIIKMYSESDIMAMGDLMTIINSTDGGSNWKVQKTGITNYIFSAFFSPFDETILGAGEKGTIYKSIDRGANWTESKLNINNHIFEIVLADKNAGWLVGEKGIIYKTTNGGNNWISQNSKVSKNLMGLSFPNLNVGYAVGDDGIVLKTTNGGSVWSQLNSPTIKGLKGVAFVNLYKGFIYGNDGVFYKTTNGGSVWSQIVLPTNKRLNDLKFVNSVVGFLVADSGLVFKTSDGGNNWVRKSIPDTLDLHTINFYNSSVGIASGENGFLLKTTNGGESWSNYLIDRLGKVSLKTINFVNDDHGYIDISPDTLYLKTTNGGANWFYQTIGDSVNKVFFISGSIGWAVGDSGKILKTVDGGSSWHRKESNTTVNLVNLSFIDFNNGWCTGNNGYLLTTSDGGNSWLSQNVGSDNNYSQVLFSDANNGWVLTDGAEILKTTDGGANWNFQSNPINKNLMKLFFWNNQYGWGLYGDNQIIRTTDGGSNWELINTGYTNISDIYFVDNYNGWAAGDNIIHTSDGGLTWIHQDLVTKNKINGLYFKNYNHGWAVGEAGTILEFDNTDFVILPPNLLSPSNNSTDITLTPNFDWTIPNRAVDYQLQISKLSDFSNTIIDEIFTNNYIKLELFKKLEVNTDYFWRVKARNTTEESFWSAVYKFKTQDKLSKPTLLTPSNGALSVIHKPFFSWTEVELAARYVIQYSENIYFDPNLTTTDTVNADSFSPPSFLKQLTNYFWRVKAINEANESDWANVFEFTTDLLAIPNAPTLLEHGNNVIDVAKNDTLKWLQTEHAIRYRLQISKDNLFQNLIKDESNLTDTFFVYSNLEIATDYYWRVKAYNWLDDESNWSQTWKFTTITYELIPDSWDVTVDTGVDATILIPANINPTIDSRSILRGDAIGIFYSDGKNFKCAGFGIWNNQNLAITVWGDNSQTIEKDGFSQNEKYFFKIWDGQKGIEIYAQFTITSGPDAFSTDAYTILGQLQGITPTYHKNYLKSGWNLISSYVSPENPSLEAVFDNIIDKVVIVKNKSGNAYIPSYGINNIGNWDYKHAYQVYMSEGDTLLFKGIELKPENETINFVLGWHFVGYLMNKNNSVVNSLATLTASNSLLLCKNSIGQVYIPQYNVNTIGDMIVGQGYRMYITNPPANLKYPANPPLRDNLDRLTPSPKYLLPTSVNTGNYSIVLLEVKSNDYNEIGVYNNDNLLIGSGVVFNNLATLIIWEDNIQTEIIDGALSGEKLTFRMFNIQSMNFENLEIDLLIDLITNTQRHGNVYEPNSVLAGEGKYMHNNDDLIIYPIPAKDKIFINSEDNIDYINIYNTDGKLILKFETNKTYNHQQVELNLISLPNGEYNIKLFNSNNVINKKILISK